MNEARYEVGGRVNDGMKKRAFSRVCLTVSLAALVTSIGCGKPAEFYDGPPRLEELADETFSGIGNRPVRLRNGKWEGKPYSPGGASRPVVGLADHFLLEGDLNGDGSDDSAVVLWENSGGSGTRSYLAVMSRSGKKIENLGTTLIGDRVQVRSGWIVDRRVILDLVRAGPADAACCPSERALVSWSLTDGGLTQLEDEVIGILSLADIEGPEWRLAEIGWGDPIPEDVEATLQFQGNKVAGTGGCNRFFGSVASESPGELEFSGMGTTQMACPESAMDVERRFLTTLARATSYGFATGRLLLTCETQDGMVVLIFDLKKEPSEPADATP